MRSSIAVAVVCLALAAAPALGVSLGQVDDFQDGTTQGWGSGVNNPNPPVNLSDAGPGGAGDHALRALATGGPANGGKLVIFNSNQWAGDYVAAAVTALQMDILNSGDSELILRLALRGPGGDFSSTDGVTVAVGSGWQNIALPVAPGDLSPAPGGFDVDATLGNVNFLRLIHAAAPVWMADPVDTTLRVDNVSAVPEPLTMAMMGVGAMILLRRRR